MKVYLNGELKEKQELSEVFEPGFLFGWGVFEPLRVYAGKPAFLEEHLNRLVNSCRLLSLEAPGIDWRESIAALLKENGLSDAYVRLTVYKKRKDTGISIYADDFRYYASPAYANGFTAMIPDIKRNQNDLSCRVKTISYLNNRLAWAQAQAKGKDEALMLNLNDRLSGGSRSNLFLVQGGNVLTPALEEGAFCGITRKVITGLLAEMGYRLRHGKVTQADLLNSEEAFLTSSLLEVMPLVACDSSIIGAGAPGPKTQKILSAYRSLVC